MINSSQKELLKRQAQKRNGVFRSGFFFGRPAIELNVAQSKILVYFDNKKTPATTHFDCMLLLKSDPGIHIAPQKYGSISISGTSFQDINVGHGDFDRAFIIQGKRDSVVQLLTDKIMDGLLSFQPFSPVVVVEKGRLQFFTKAMLEREGDIGRFIDLGVEILYQAKRL